MEHIAQAKAIDEAASLQVGAHVHLALDSDGDAAVYYGRTLIGWPASGKERLRKCLADGSSFEGRVVERGGTRQAPYLEVSVAGS